MSIFRNPAYPRVMKIFFFSSINFIMLLCTIRSVIHLKSVLVHSLGKGLSYPFFSYGYSANSTSFIEQPLLVPVALQCCFHHKSSIYSGVSLCKISLLSHWPNFSPCTCIHCYNCCGFAMNLI